MKNIERAKEIFLFYNGSFCNMARNDHKVYKEYESYHISEEQEYSWIEEYQIQLLKRIENSIVLCPPPRIFFSIQTD